MNEAIWSLIKRILENEQSIPQWIDAILSRSAEKVSALTVFDGTGLDIEYQPSVEQKELKNDYLDFLEEQIVLNARGINWGNVLRRRLEALRPYVGKVLLTVTFYKGLESFTYKLSVEDEHLIYFEHF